MGRSIWIQVSLVFSFVLFSHNLNAATTCETMCSNVYDTCSLTLENSSGDALTEAQCVTACAGTHADVVSCLTTVACTRLAIDVCLVTGLNRNSAAQTESNDAITDDTGTMSACDACIYECNRNGSYSCCTGCGCDCMYQCLPTDFLSTCP